VQRTLAGIWWYNSGDIEAEPCSTPATKLKDKLLAARAERAQERRIEDVFLESEKSKQPCITVPIPTSLVAQKEHLAPPNEEPSGAPGDGMADGSTLTSSTPGNQTNIQLAPEQSPRRPRLTTSFLPAGDGDGMYVEEEERGPEYSPISPPPDVDPLVEPEENHEDANLSDHPWTTDAQASTIHPALSEQGHEHEMEIVSNRVLAGNVAVQAASSVQATNMDAIANYGNAVSLALDPDPDTSRGTATFILNPAKELSPDVQSTPTQEIQPPNLQAETLISQTKTVASMRKVPAKRTPVPTEPRRSVRINGPAGRVLRPRT
jgi:hypothetical protein